MKKILTLILILMLSMFMIVACSESSSTKDRTNDQTKTEETQSTEETSSPEKSSEEENEETKNEEESGEGDSVATGNAQDVLAKAADAMAEVTSFKATSEYYDDSTLNGQNTVTDTKFTMELVYGDPAMMYAQATSTSNETEEGAFEMYMTGEHIYINSEENWFSMPTDSEHADMYDQFKGIEKDHMEGYANHSDLFEIQDNENHYLFTFTGNGQEYKEVVIGAGGTALGGILEEHYDNMEITDGVYEIKIDKDTYYMTHYQMEYSARTSGEIGDVEQHYKGTFELSNFNEIDDIVVPEAVKEQAQPLVN
ncbi:DUF6612 family protein [Salinibacillus xinjiangensis]|uniref:Uncharacterized protein n=1 Tax=Salinibacillus xinjiangensis TaxID=1229268 RepID=A0A6G1XA26_9BACI|nr:DUF6612 family protein [Salinibacillus xinjiangensis]MRG87797.1 hypothetical protein [Salinibacillus xinjiangensis]